MRAIYKTLIISMLVSGCQTVKTPISSDQNPLPDKPIEVEIIETPKETDYEKIMGVFNNTMGTPYLYGGTGTDGWDCSGYANYVYDKVYKIDLPRSTELMWNYGERVSKPEIGDLVFFSPTDTYNHVGIYVGNLEFIHSSSSRGIIKSNVKDPYYWGKYFVMYRRVK